MKLQMKIVCLILSIPLSLLFSCRIVEIPEQKENIQASTYDLLLLLGDPCLNTVSDAAIELQNRSDDDVYLNAKKLFNNNASTGSLVESIYLCRDKVPERIRELEPYAFNNGQPCVIAAMMDSMVLSGLKPADQEINSYSQLLKHDNVTVRLRAAALLPNCGKDLEVFSTLLAELDNYETHDNYYDEFPASVVAKQILADWKPLQGLVRLINHVKPADPIIKYHLIDACAVNAGKNDTYVFSIRGNPTKEMIEKLDKAAKELGIGY